LAHERDFPHLRSEETGDMLKGGLNSGGNVASSMNPIIQSVTKEMEKTVANE
jgi:hypothetical protein